MLFMSEIWLYTLDIGHLLPVGDGPIEEVGESSQVGVVHERALHRVHHVPLVGLPLQLDPKNQSFQFKLLK